MLASMNIQHQKVTKQVPRRCQRAYLFDCSQKVLKHILTKMVLYKGATYSTVQRKDDALSLNILFLNFDIPPWLLLKQILLFGNCPS